MFFILLAASLLLHVYFDMNELGNSVTQFSPQALSLESTRNILFMWLFYIIFRHIYFHILL